MTFPAPIPDDAGPGDPPPGLVGVSGGPGRPPTRDNWKRSALEWFLVIVGALAIAFTLRATTFQVFYIPSGSMEPTLAIGDRVVVNQWSYRLHDVNRGDIVVFSRPPGESSAEVKDLIKRVVGLPGDTVTIADDHVLINGDVLDEPYLPQGTHTDGTGTPHVCRAHHSVHDPRRRGLGDGRQPHQLARQPLLRADQGILHRRTRLRAPLALQPHQRALSPRAQPIRSRAVTR